MDCQGPRAGSSLPLWTRLFALPLYSIPHFTCRPCTLTLYLLSTLLHLVGWCDSFVQLSRASGHCVQYLLSRNTKASSMAGLSEQLTLSPGVKRTHDGEPLPSSAQMPGLSPPRHTQPLPLRRSQSPALSTTSSSLTDLSSSAPQSSNAPQNSLTGPTGPPGAPLKKRKLTFAEKQVKKAEDARLKEEKAKQKAEDQARKDEGKRLKDEEKRKKAEEREAAKKVKEVEKAEKEAAKAEKQKAKDDEKARQEAERLKKERVSAPKLYLSALS